MNNPLRILQAVDARLDQPMEFYLFGRAALVLGFADPPAEAAATRDVDGIIPHDLLAGLQANHRWWPALKAANDELKAEGLYLTHLFGEEQIILRANRREQAVDVPSAELRFPALRRPATIDLILTKMMRGPDPDDMRDVRFYLQREPAISVEDLQAAFETAVGPDIPEIWQLSRSPSQSCYRWSGNPGANRKFQLPVNPSGQDGKYPPAARCPADPATRERNEKLPLHRTQDG